MRPFREGLRAPLLLAAVLLALALLALGTTTWRQPASGADPVTGSTVGPFAAGESFSQRFSSEVSYLTGVSVRVRARGGGGAPVDAELHFRLYESGDLIREGQVSVSGLPESSHPVSWSFGPIFESAGREYKLQVVVAEISGGRLIADTTMEDTLPGPVITNGIPSGEHIDLVLRPFRELRRTGVLLAVGDSVPGGRLGAALFLGALGAIGGLGLRTLRYGHKESGPMAWLVWAILGVAIASLAASAPLIQFRSTMAAENDPGFILATRGTTLAAALTPWVILVAAKATGRLADLRGSGLKGRVFVSAGAVSAIGLLLLVMTEEPAYFQWIEMVGGGRPEQGRIGLLQQVNSASFLRVSLAAWIVAWLLGAGGAASSSARPHGTV